MAFSLRKMIDAVDVAGAAVLEGMASLFRGEPLDPSRAEHEDRRAAENSVYKEMAYALSSLNGGLNMSGIDSEMSFEEAERHIKEAKDLLWKHRNFLDEDLILVARDALDELSDYGEYELYSRQHRPRSFDKPDAMLEYRELVRRGVED